MSDKSVKRIPVDFEVATDDLCSVYGCDHCPGFLGTEEGEFVFCVHDCYKASKQTSS
jgi:hypothetical protein